MLTMRTLLWTSVVAMFYIVAGYPLLLHAIIRLRGARPVRRSDDLPTVSLLISAYNEGSVIRAKLRNSLALDYPRERLEIIVISDGSTDDTDAIVNEFAADGVRLRRQHERRGKTAGLNDTVPDARGEVLVFSDANAMYRPAALRMLVRNFGDPAVGCVTGEARYVKSVSTLAEAGEMAYWSYEMAIKRLETAVGSMVGGDGAIYAIRASLWRPLPANAINDLLNPLQLVAAGWRAVYEPEAICHEEAAGSIAREYQRRVRIVSRSWRAIFQVPAVLNPFRTGFFSVSVVSHKMLRWLGGVFVLMALVGTVSTGSAFAREYVWHVAGASVFLTATCLAVLRVRRSAAYGAYFLAITAASLVGVVKGSLGRVKATWTPPRGVASPTHGASSRQLPTGRVLQSAFAAAAMAFAWMAVSYDTASAMRALFWSAAGALLYVYGGYPLVLRLLRSRRRRTVEKAPVEPAVCLLITANDEETVMAAKLRNSLDLQYPRGRLRIVVASDGSVDRTNDIVRSFAADGVVLISCAERRGKIATINAALPAVGEEIVVFSDANTFVHTGAIRALVRNFADPEVGAVSGDVALVGERAALAHPEDLYYRWERWLQQAESDIGSMMGVDGALYAVRRELIVPPPADTILDDMAIPMAVLRAGRRVIFEREALAFERGSETAREEFARKSRVVAGAVQFLRRRDSHVPLGDVQVVLAMTSHKALRWLSPVFAALMFASSLALAGESLVFRIVAAGQLLFLASGALGCIPVIRRTSVIGIAHYFWLVQSAAAVGFCRGLAGRQPVTWRRFARGTVPAVRAS